MYPMQLESIVRTRGIPGRMINNHESRARLFEGAAGAGGPGMGAADWAALKAICGAG